MAGQLDGVVRIGTQINTSGIDKGAQTITSKLKGLAKTVGVAFSVAQIVKFGSACIELASDITEVDNVVSKSFGSMRYKIDELANNSIKSLGMSRLTAYETASTFMSMGKAMGDTEANASDMAISLTKLTGNMASFYNKEQDLVSIALKSVYTGETETLKQYGIVMTETNLKQFALAQGITKAYSAMTQAEKVQLRYNYVMAQTAFIGDDFLDTQDSWANQTRILSEQWKEFMSVLGSGLITVLTPVLRMINSVVGALITFANAVGKFMSSVFGIKAQQMSVASANDTVSSSYEDATESAEGYTDATNSASKASKNAVAAFDDVNVLSTDSGSGSGSGGGGGSDSGIEVEEVEAESSAVEELSTVVQQVQRIWQSFCDGVIDGWTEASDILDLTGKVASIKASCETIRQEVAGIWNAPEVQGALNRFAYNVGNALGKISASVVSVGLTIGEAITGGIANWLTGGGSDEVKQYIVDMLDITGDTAQIYADYSVAFAEIFSALGSEEGKNFVANLIDGISTTIGTITETLAKLGRDMADMLFSPITENSAGLNELLTGMLDTFNIFGEGVNQVIDYIADAWTRFYDESLSPLFASIGDGLSTLLGVFVEAWQTYIKPALDELGTSLSALWSAMTPIFNLVQQFLSWISPFIQVLWKNILVPLLSFIIQTMAQGIASFINKISTHIQGIANTINLFVESFKITVEFVKTLINNAIEFIKALFVVLSYKVVDAMNGVLGAIERVGNGVVKMVNWALDGIRSFIGGLAQLLSYAGISISIPSLSLGNLSLPRASYPALANGGITTGSTLAQIGEAGREAVLPLENNTGWMDDLAGKLADLMGGNNEAVMEIDGKRFGQLVYPYVRSEGNRVGTSLATN